MLNRKRIERAVSEAEQSFKDCWLKLLTLRKCVEGKSEMIEAIVSFQPTLGIALYRLETLYNQICQEGRELISRKSDLNKKWFRHRLHTLNGFKRLLRATMDVGKALGDSFAWMFYQNERELLRRHDEHEPNPHLPTGIGGRGEIEFIRGLPKFGDHLVLAHSITTFLRLGDVSLVDLVEGKVAAIGELKTCANGDNQLTVTINLVGRNLRKDRLPKSVEGQHTPFSSDRRPLPPPILERLKRQIERIQESFKPVVSNQHLAPAQVSATFHHSKVEELYRSPAKLSMERIKADRGLLVIGIRLKGESLFSRLAGKHHSKRNLDRLRITEDAREIVDLALKDNSLRFGWLPYPAQGRYSLSLGMRPLFWWSLETEIIEALLFRRFAVMTLYNPVFLIDDLRRCGIEVEALKEGGIRIWKKSGDKEFRIFGIPYFLELVQAHLFADSAVVALIQKMVESAERADFKQPATVNLDLQFLFH
ncbi:MAG: hypothetical protein IH623_13665 [Verrucomicrobia bacterium]|nr:hypothetical protein [Verrucomicrobiota bacterium]